MTSSELDNVETTLLQRLKSSSQSRDLGLYIHIPFCQKRCRFCAFYLIAHREDRVREYVSGLAHEIELYASKGQCRRFPVSTIYLGGGTPTSLDAEQLARILITITQHFPLHASPEISVEADPYTVTRKNLQVLLNAGVSRLSFGVQSLEESEWKHLGRLGDVGYVGQAMKLAQEVGFSNLSVDMMYGLPGQTLKSWQHSLEQVVLLDPCHVSCYALTIEEGTRFHQDRQEGKLPDANLEVEIAMQEQAIDYLQCAGYRQYEVSNFARAGYECRHNLRYWSGLDYLGLGPSSQSYISGMRFGNVADLETYSRVLARGQLPVESLEVLSIEESLRERVVFGLRLNQGVSATDLQELEKDDRWRSTVHRLINLGWLSRENQRLRVTTMGRRFIDSVSVELL